MIRATSWLVACLVPCSQAVAQPPLSCEPTASCALRMARDAAFVHFETTREPAERALSLMALNWVGEQEKTLDGATLRNRFAALRTRLDQLPDEERGPLLVGLAITLAASDLIDEAQAIAGSLPSEDARDAVRASIACGQARRGRVREAFAALETMRDAREKDETFDCVLEGITTTGRPELTRDAAQYLDNPSLEPVDITELVALTELAAGNHTAARATAVSRENAKSRIDTLYRLMNRYDYLYNHAEATATARLLRDVIGNLDDPKLDHNIRSSVVHRLAETYTPADIPALIRQLPIDDRVSVLRILVYHATDPGVIREAGRLLEQISPDDRADVQLFLMTGRVSAGELKPADALAQSDHPESLVNLFSNLVGDLADDKPVEAQEMLKAAIAANDAWKGPAANAGGKDIQWRFIAQRQVDLGSLADARKTIDSRIRDKRIRGQALIGLSGAEAQQGKPEAAARTREDGLRLLKSSGAPADHYSVAFILDEWGNLDAAESELCAGMRGNTPGLRDHDATINVIIGLARRGELRRALELAARVSTHLQDNPEPFLLVYDQVAGVDGVCLFTPMLKNSCRID
jgi:hypothetical protein